MSSHLKEAALTEGTPAPRDAAAAGPVVSASLSATPELLAELAARAEEFETFQPAQILKWAVERFAPRFSMA
ncbi:MAG TPA: hypothetical protein DCE55_24960, partial [Planctomycetaceae bacterium]|nr:hypothetical protein [Planctomycetaceae bacterium]